MKVFILSVAALMVSTSGVAIEPPPLEQEIKSGRPGSEFFYREIGGQKMGGPDAFMRSHTARQSIPAPLGIEQRPELASKAWRSFEQVRFRGTSKGRQGVWQLLGPVTEADDILYEPKNSTGRVTDLLTGDRCSQSKCRLYVATAGGGVWRTDRALHPTNPGWEHLSNGLPSNNIGSLSEDPNDPSKRTFYVGTGESNFAFTSGAGVGVFKTTNGGDSFSKVPTWITDLDISPEPIDFTATRGVTRVAVKPGDPNTLYVATATAMLGMTAVRGGQSTITGGPQAKVGVYKTTDGGASWTQVFDAPIDTFSSTGTPDGAFQLISGAKDIQFDPQDPDTAYISIANDGVYRSSVMLDGDDAFRKVFEVVGTARDNSYAAFDLVAVDETTRIYLYNGNSNIQNLGTQVLYRVDDVRVVATDLHTGGINQAVWRNLTELNEPKDFTDWQLCNQQCVYDLVVKVPDDQPDTVYLGGQVPTVAIVPMLRSVDGGENFQLFAVDLQETPGFPHVDVRAFAFSPDNSEIVFTGSDGGVVRNDGEFADGRSLCTEFLFIEGSFRDQACQFSAQSVPNEFIFMNRGLAAMQLFNISGDPNRPLKRLITGTQDNSTQIHDGTKSAKVWRKLFDIGDGTSANGFHREDPNILFASFQSASFYTHFRGGEGGTDSWLFTSGPFFFLGIDQIFYPNQPPGSGRQFITFDPIDADTQFTAFEHVWRTQNNGGDQAFLEANCRRDNEESFFKPECGDWVPLGPYLTRDENEFIIDRSVVSAAERTPADTGTLWAGTSLGRVWVSSNADAEDPATVTFTRLDTPDTPPRFVSGIAVDHENPNRAFITYSGFNAVTPDQPGHVFEVVYDPDTATASFSELDFNLPDMPVNHIVRDDLTGDLYIANDYGVLALPAGSSQWELSGAGLPPVLTPHLEIHPSERVLLAATHGLGAWSLNLPRVKTGNAGKGGKKP